MSPSGGLLQVGDRFRYRVTVTNEGDTELEDVVVQQFVPAELTVVGVPILDEVEGINLSRFGDKEDITWILGDVSPGETFVLPWLAKVHRSGDFNATGSITLSSSGDERSLRPPGIFIGTVKGLRITDAGVASVKRRVVTTRQVTLPAESSGAPGLLPATGATGVALFVTLAVALLGAGCLLLLAASRRTRAVTVVVALLLAGCVGDGDRAAVDPNQTPEVKGRVIDRDGEPEDAAGTPSDQDERADEAAPDDDGRDGDGPDASTRPEPETDTGGGTSIATGGTPSVTIQTVREVRTIRVPVSTLPVTEVGATAGDNAISLEWSEAGGLQSALSSILFSPDAPLSLRTALTADGKKITVEIALRNERADRRVKVEGRILHEISGLAGGPKTLTSEPISIVLAPGAVSVETFVYTLPTGSYSLTSRFAPS